MSRLLIIILSIAGVLGAAAVVTVIAVTGTLNSSTQPAYTLQSAGALDIVQRSAHEFDVEFDLDDEMAEGSSLSIQLTENPDYVADQATDVTFERTGSHIVLSSVNLAPGDHYLWLTTPEGRTPMVVTIPAMQQRIWIDGENPTIEFGQADGSSWSSYVDPEGKAVYRSASPTFDATAQLLSEGIAITQTGFRVENPDPTLPYYFLVFTGRDGDSTFVTSPLFATATQGAVSVEIAQLDGETKYVISGFLAARDDVTDRTHTLRVGNFNPSNPAATFLVDSSSESGTPGQFRFVVPAAEISDGYSDLSIFLTEDGSTLEWSIDATGVDLGQKLVDDQTVYGIRRVEALQLTRLDLPYDRLSVSLTESGGTPQLRVSGRFTEEAAAAGYQLVVKDTDNERHTAEDVAATLRNFSFTVDLSSLDTASVWYDVELLPPGSSTSIPISTASVNNMRQWLATPSRTYAFADYEGLLKVFFDDSPFANQSVQLATVDGIPSLVATGDLVNTATSDAMLRIRTNGSTLSEVRNSSSTPGTFRFVYNLTTLSKADTWYDVTFWKPSAGRTLDFPVTAVADPSQTLVTSDYREYGFHDFEGQLKVAFQRIPGAVDVTSASLLDVGGAATLHVEGTLDRLASDDVFLRIRSAGQTIDVPNTAVTAGDALFEYNLAGMATRDDWYDVLIGVTSTGSLTDVPASSADLAQSVTIGGRAYSLHEFNSQLKVSYAPAPMVISTSSAEIVDEAGVPTLLVTGTATGATGSDLFLRVRTGAQTIDAANVATTAGEFSFAVDLSSLTQGGTWYDLVVGVTSTGQLADLSTAAADLAQTLLIDERTYAFHEYAGALKVAYDDTPVTASATAVALEDTAGVPTYVVDGTFSGTTGDDVFLRIRSGAQSIDVPNTSTTAGVLHFAYDGSGLTQVGTWYDVLLGVTSSGQLTDVSSALADQAQTLARAGRTYEFHEYGGDLKVAYQGTAAIAGLSTELVDVSGVPTLRVAGTLTNTANGDVFVRVRSGSQTVDVPNTAVSGAALFEYDLSQLSSEGTWYDLLLGVSSTGDITDLADATADLSQTVALDGRSYAFHEYAGALKVAFDVVPIAVTTTAAELVDAAGTPTLRVEGTLTGTSNADAFLRIRTSAQTVDVPNTATSPGTVLFEYDVAELTEGGTWYDLLAGISSTSDLTDLSTSAADMAQTVTRDNRLYSFQEYSGQLKVAFGDAPASVTVDLVEILDASGAPTLRVSGTVERTTDDDVFLRIRSGSQSVDVANTAPTAGAALFEYDLSALDYAGANYELLIGTTSTASTLAIGEGAASLTQFVALDGRSYEFSAIAGDLLVGFTDTPVAVEPSSIEIVTDGGVPTLRVVGTVTGTSNADALLRIRSAGSTVDVENTATVAGLTLFEYDLSGLAESGTWYDLLVGTVSVGEVVDLPTTLADLGQTVAVAGHNYGFREYAGDLKVAFENVTITLSISTSELLEVGGAPVLRVTGAVSGTDNSDTFLRARTGPTVLDTPNTSTTDGSVLYEYDLSSLTSAGSWYDLLAGVTSSGSLADLDSSTASMAQTITVNDRQYSFHEYGGQLKVAFADLSAAGMTASAQLVDPTTTVTSTTAPSATGADEPMTVEEGAKPGTDLVADDTSEPEPGQPTSAPPVDQPAKSGPPPGKQDAVIPAPPAREAGKRRRVRSDPAQVLTPAC